MICWSLTIPSCSFPWSVQVTASSEVQSRQPVAIQRPFPYATARIKLSSSPPLAAIEARDPHVSPPSRDTTRSPPYPTPTTAGTYPDGGSSDEEPPPEEPEEEEPEEEEPEE